VNAKLDPIAFETCVVPTSPRARLDALGNIEIELTEVRP